MEFGDADSAAAAQWDLTSRQRERLREEGVAILYTSHKLSEVKRICDRVSVLRDGAMVRSAKVSEISEDEMAAAMVGRELSDLYPAKAIPHDEKPTMAPPSIWPTRSSRFLSRSSAC